MAALGKPFGYKYVCDKCNHTKSYADVPSRITEGGAKGMLLCSECAQDAYENWLQEQVDNLS